MRGSIIIEHEIKSFLLGDSSKIASAALAIILKKYEHVISSIEKNVCPFCGKSSSKPRWLRRHLSVSRCRDELDNVVKDVAELYTKIRNLYTRNSGRYVVCLAKYNCVSFYTSDEFVKWILDNWDTIFNKFVQ
jgi:hypothetical protein